MDKEQTSPVVTPQNTSRRPKQQRVKKANAKISKKSQVVLILGMHRSGTSAVARGVGALGYDMGDNLMPKSKDNVKGYWEDIDVVQLNDEILSSLDSSWDNVASFLSIDAKKNERVEELALSINELLKDKFSNKEYIAIKDPRISVLLPLWQSQLETKDFSVKKILCLRSPQGVVDSLSVRDSFSETKSAHLWYEYNRRVLDSVVDDILIVSYEQILSQPMIELKRIGDYLNISAQKFNAKANQKRLKNYCENYLDLELNHSNKNNSVTSVLPSYVNNFYNAIIKYSGSIVTKNQARALLDIGLPEDKSEFFANEALNLSETVSELRIKLSANHKDLCNIEEQYKSAIHVRNMTAESNKALQDTNSSLKETIQSLRDSIEAKQESLLGHQQASHAFHEALSISRRELEEVQHRLSDQLEFAEERRLREVKHLEEKIKSYETSRNAEKAELELGFQNQLKVMQEEHSCSVERMKVHARNLSAEITQRDHEIGRLNRLTQDLWSTIHGFQQSKSWQITSPFRFIGRNSRRALLALKNIMLFLKVLGVKRGFEKSRMILKQEGLGGIKSRLARGPKNIAQPQDHLPIQEVGSPQEIIPSAIKRSRSGEYTVQPGLGEYTYISPRKPANFDLQLSAIASPAFFSIVVPLYNTPIDLLEKVIDSVNSQWYSNWELILINDASPNSNVGEYLEKISQPNIVKLDLERNKGIAGSTNVGLQKARGDYIVFLDHDDELTPDCLFELLLCIQRDNPDFIYSDEDKIDTKGNFVEPHYKPSWSPDTMMSTMYTCHVSCVKRSLIDGVGGLRSEYDGCQDWDLILRVTERTKRISHIPKVLYHWRIIPQSIAADLSAKPYAIDASKRVREDALKRRGVEGSLEPIKQVPGYFTVNYQLTNEPLISIIIPSRDNGAVLGRCVSSIFDTTNYAKYEIIILDNGSIEAETLDYLSCIQSKEKIKVIRHDAEFNFSELNNIGVRNSNGEILLFLNDDTEILQANWLETLGGYAQQDHVGAVGAKLLYPNTNQNQHAGVLNLEDGPGHAFHKLDGDEPGYYMRNLIEYNWLAVTGACLMIERDKFEKIGRFDEELPIAYNDVDLCMRAIKPGFFNVVCQQTRLIHHESVSRGVDDIDPEKRVRLQKEHRHLYQLHPEFYQHDPFYNLNLHPNGINFELGN